MKYRYIAYDPSGRKTKGTVEAENESQAVYFVRCQDLSPALVKPQRETAPNIWQMEIMEPDVHNLKIGKKALFQFSEKMAIMLHAGVSLAMALDVIISGEKNHRYQKIFRAIRTDLYSGLTLSGSTRQFRAFPREFVSMISAGEGNGKLDWAFEQISQLYQSQLEYREKVTSAMAYPAFLLLLWAAMFVGMTAFVLPRFSDMYDRFNAQLPALTRFMMDASVLLKEYGLLMMFLAVVLLGAVVLLMAKNHSLRMKAAALALKLPVFGRLSLVGNTSRLTQVSAALLHSGVEVVDTLQIAASVLTNPYLSGAVSLAADEISRGASLYAALQKRNVFEPLLLSMVHIAEESSMVPETFAKLAALYRKESIHSLRKATAVLEPVLTLIVGLVIAVMVLAVVMPMFRMYGTILG